VAIGDRLGNDYTSICKKNTRETFPDSEFILSLCSAKQSTVSTAVTGFLGNKRAIAICVFGLFLLLVFYELMYLCNSSFLSLLIPTGIVALLSFLPVRIPFDITLPGQCAAYTLISISRDLSMFVEELINLTSSNSTTMLLVKKDIVRKEG